MTNKFFSSVDGIRIRVASVMHRCCLRSASVSFMSGQSLLTTLLLSLTLFIGTGQMWGAAQCIAKLGSTTKATVNISSTNHSSGTADVVSWSGTNTSQKSSQWRFGETTTPSTITFSVSSGYQINSVVMSTSASYLGNWSSNAGTVSGLSCTGINASSVTLTTTSKARINTVTVTYSAAASCDKKVSITKGTPESGGSFNLDKTGAQDCCNALTVTVSNITAPSGKQFGAITQSGINSGVTIDQNAKTVTYAANSSGSSTINVTFVDLPKYTVTLMDDNDTRTQASYGAAVTLPSRAGCTGYTFAGWTKTWVAPQSSWTTTAPTIIPAGSYTPTADENLYPVYTKTEGGGALQTVTIFEETCSSRPTSTTSITNSDSNWDATGGNLTGVSISGSARTYNSGITNPPCFGFTSTNYKDLTISGINTNGYTNLTLSYLIKGNQSGGTYATYTVSTNAASNNSVELTTSGTATTCSTASALSSLSIPATSSLTLTFTAGSNIQNRAFYVDDIKITGQTGGSTTYYISVPNCCTPLVSINGSFNRYHLKIFHHIIMSMFISLIFKC